MRSKEGMVGGLQRPCLSMQSWGEPRKLIEWTSHLSACKKPERPKQGVLAVTCREQISLSKVFSFSWSSLSNFIS